MTVRGEKAMQLIEAGLKVKEYELLRKNFSDSGELPKSVFSSDVLGMPEECALQWLGPAC